MRLIVIAALLLASCAPGPRVIGNCSPAGLDEALTEACERWPETCEVGQRMDFSCLDGDRIESISYCGWGRSPEEASSIDACTMRIGSPVVRGRVYVREGIDVAAAARHEAQHWHLWDDIDSNACETHDPACGWVED